MRSTTLLCAISVVLILSACQQFMDNTQRVGYNMRKEVVKSSNRVSDYFRVEEGIEPEPKRQVMAPRYCYQVLTDIVCYRNPQPGGENRLVGHYEPPIGEVSSDMASQESYTLPAQQQVHVTPLPAAGAAQSVGTPQALIER